MLSEASQNLSLSRFDLNLMQSYGQDETYNQVQLKHNRLKPTEKPIKKVLVISKLFYPDAPYELTLEYLEITLHGLRDHTPYQFDLKPHPKEPIDRLHYYADRMNITLILGSLSKIILGYDLIISPFSTTIIECLEAGKPFLIFRSPYDRSDTFICKIDPRISYSNKIEMSAALDFIVGLDASSINKILVETHNNYFGEPV